MGLIITNSPDIDFLSASVLFDISGVTPSITVTNQSSGPNLAAVDYAFIVQSPTLTYIHNGSLSDPDVTGNWTTFLISDSWPRPFNQIEWSGAPYSFQILAKDSEGNEYSAPVQNASICRPNGNLPTSKNAYGKGEVLVQVKCDQARILFQDITNASYKGLTGTIGSSVLRVNFPMDETGVVPTPFVGGNFSTAMVPITYSGKGYQFLYTSIYQYELAEDTFVRIKYLLSDTFGVFCNIDLMPLICEIQKLISSIETGSCNNVEEANRKLMLINPKFSLVMIGMLQPLTGVDVPALIREIEEIGGFPCDCCNAPTGITPPGSSAFDGYTFSVVPLGGDIEGQFVPNGFNIQLQLSDVSYIFKICDTSPAQTTAFTVIPTTSLDGYTKTYCLQVDVTQLAEDILTTISTSGELVNLFNSIVQSQAGNFQLLVDGDCIFGTAATCDYSWSLENIPASATFAILKYLFVPGSGAGGGTDKVAVNFSFNLTNLTGLQTALNALGYGTFVVTDAGGGDVTITSANNTNDISNLAYSVTASTLFAPLTKNCGGFVPKNANEVVQAIIDYLCSLDDAQVQTSQAYEICYIDPADNTRKTSVVNSGATLVSFITELMARGCDTVTYIQSLNAVNCNSIKAQFPASINAMMPNDIFFVTKAGACSSVFPVEAFLTMLTYGAYNQEVLNAFCILVNLCQGGNACAPYDVFYVTVEEGSPADGLIDLIVNFDHPAAVSNTIRYARIDNTNSPTYITIPGILPGQNPYTISGVSNGQYRVGITPVYADGRTCTELFYETPACTGITSFSATYDGSDITVTYTAVPALEAVKVNIQYPNGGLFSQIYNNGDPIVIAPPAEVFGTFLITMQPVCDTISAFFGVATAPTAIVINPANNSEIQNLTAGSNFNVEILADSTTILGTSALSVANTVEFYIGDGTYGNIQVRGVVSGFIVKLVTGTGTYYGVSDGLGKYNFGSIPILNGAIISILDDNSPLEFTFNVENNSLSTINSVSPIFYLVAEGTFPLTSESDPVRGTHGGFTGIITVAYNVTGDACASLYINDVFTEAISLTVSPTSYSSRTYNAGDKIDIIIETGVCV